MISFFSKILFFLLILSGFLNSQEEKAVAEIGELKIYESEFKERFDFSAHPRLLSGTGKEKAKLEFLKQLISEKLLSLKAQESKYDISEIYKNVMESLEDVYIRDALYSREIKKKISFSQDAINEGLKRIKKILKINFIYSKNSEVLQQIYAKLIEGASFDSLLALRPETRDQNSAREVTFGTMAENIEDILFRLKPGSFTPPVKSEDGWYILKLISTEPNTGYKDERLMRQEVERIISRRAEYQNYLRYYNSFFSDHRATADRENFEMLAEIFSARFQKKYAGGNSSSGKFYLRGGEVFSLKDPDFSFIKDKVFIDLQERPVDLKMFLNQLSLDGFFVRDISEYSIRASLSSYIRKFIEDQLLAAEGRKLQLDDSPDVKKYINMWKDSYLAGMLMSELFDSAKVSEEEAYSFFIEEEKKSPAELINSVEILTDSLHVIETVLNELSKGKSLKDIAGFYTQRDSLKERNGEFGYHTLAEYGQLAKYLAGMNPGEIYGPVKTGEGYSIIQMLDKRKPDPGYLEEYNVLKDQIVMKLTFDKFEKFVSRYTADLASKYGVKIHEDILNEIENSFTNLVVVRYMGFGGEIFAVPFTEQFTGWYDIWMKKRDLVQ